MFPDFSVRKFLQISTNLPKKTSRPLRWKNYFALSYTAKCASAVLRMSKSHNAISELKSSVFAKHRSRQRERLPLPRNLRQFLRCPRYERPEELSLPRQEERCRQFYPPMHNSHLLTNCYIPPDCDIVPDNNSIGAVR